MPAAISFSSEQCREDGDVPVPALFRQRAGRLVLRGRALDGWISHQT
jgi:hypothetical protein